MFEVIENTSTLLTSSPHRTFCHIERSSPKLRLRGFKMSTLIGQMPYFCPGFSDWQVFTERLEQYLEANEIPAEKRKALLLTSIDEIVYKTLHDVCHPMLPKDKTYDDLMQLLNKQYIVRKSTHRERVTFYTAKQVRYETISAWFAHLKKLSVDCKFGENFDAVLLDRFISGLRSSAILDRLCEEDPTLTLAKAVEIATDKESTAGAELYDDGEDEVAVKVGQCTKGAVKKRNRRKPVNSIEPIL